jgi:hypothetical protein
MILASYDQDALQRDTCWLHRRGGRENFEPTFLRMARHQLDTAARALRLA